MTKISVIVSIYNVENYLKECIDSILTQTFREFELLLIDDGSTDHSLEICNSYAKNDDRIKVIHQTNQGLSCARNTGISNSNYDYLYFVDADDYIHKDTLNSFIQILKNHKNMDVIIGRMSIFYEGNTETNPDTWNINNDLIKNCNGQEAFVNIINKYQMFRMGIRGLYKRRFIIDNQLYFTSGLLSQDQDWTIRVLQKAETIASNSKPYYYYRKNRPYSIMNTPKLKRATDRITIYKNWISIAKDNTVNKEFSNILLSLAGNRYGYMVWDMSGTLKGEDVSKFIDEINESKNILQYSTKNKYLVMYKLMQVAGTKTTIKIYRRMYKLFDRKRKLKIQNKIEI